MHAKTAAFVLLLTVNTAGAAAQTPPQPPQTPRDTRPATALPIPDGTASISGTVTLLGTGQPVRRARVSISSQEGGGGRNVMTDELGRFTFDRLLPARYSISASKPGHVTVTFGQPRPGRPGTQIQLGEGEKFDAKLVMPRGGVITGTVLDEHGDAIPGTQVRAMRYVNQGGQRTLQGANGGATDDRGVYRIYGLQPGEYVVAAVPRNTGGEEVARLREELASVTQRAQAPSLDESQRRELTLRSSMLMAQQSELDEQATGYAPVYYPGTTSSSQAAAIALGAGEERAGADFSLVRVSVAMVEGTVVNPTNQPVSNIQVTLAPAGPSVPGVENYSARAQQDGRFRIANVPPGQYRISARAQVQNRTETVTVERPGTPNAIRVTPPAPPQEQVRLWAMADLSVDGRNVSNVSLLLQQGTTVSGRIVFEGTKAPPTDLTRVRVSVGPVDFDGPGRILGAPSAGRVDASGKFTVTNVVPGRYRLSASAAGPGWITDSAVVDGQDALDFPFEVKGTQAVTGAVITFTDQPTELSGTITDQRGQPAPGFTLIVFPADDRFWVPQSRRIRTARPATDGKFTIGNLPPGDYRLAAVEDIEPGSWFDPEVLKQFDAASMRVTLSPGEKKVQSVRVAR